MHLLPGTGLQAWVAPRLPTAASEQDAAPMSKDPLAPPSQEVTASSQGKQDPCQQTEAWLAPAALQC